MPASLPNYDVTGISKPSPRLQTPTSGSPSVTPPPGPSTIPAAPADTGWSGIGSGVSGPAAQAALIGQADARFGATESGGDLSSGGLGRTELSAAGSATNAGLSYRSNEVAQWDASGLNASLQQDLSTGNFAAAFNKAVSAGQLNAMLDPMNLSNFFPNGMTESQLQAYYNAFAPIQKQLYNKSDPSILGDDVVWNNYSTNEASQNWAATQSATLADPYKDLPNPAAFSHDPGPSDFEYGLGIVGAGLAVVAPELAPEVGASLGVGATTAGAITGGVTGAATSYGMSGGNVQDAIKGGIGGAVGGFLAGGGAQEVTQATGLPSGVVSTGVRTGLGALTGGTQGAESGLISGAASQGLQNLGLSQSISGPVGSVLGSSASAALSSPSGNTMPAASLPNYQVNDPGTQAAIGATSTLPSYSTNTAGNVPGAAAAGTAVGAAASAGGLSPDIGTLLGGALGLYGASQAQSSNNATISPLNQAAAPFLSAGQQLLGQSMSGQLTPAQQQVVTTSQQQGQTLINAATPAGQIAQQLMTQYQSGQLNTADAAQLQQQVTAAKAQIAQALGPNADSTTLATYYAQIDQQADITKQSMLNSYLATGNQEFDQWATTTEAGQAAIQAGQQYAVTSIDTTFNQALSATGLGSQNISNAIAQTLQSNQQVANSLQSYMSNLTKAYAMSQASGTPGSTTSSTGAPQYTQNNPSLDASPNQGLSNAQSNPSQYESLDPSATNSVNDILSGPSFSDQAPTGAASYSAYY